MNTTITTHKGTFVATKKQELLAWSNFLTMATLWETAPVDEDQCRDLRPMIYDYHEGRRMQTWDYLDYGEGCEGTDEDIEDGIVVLEKLETKLRFELRRVYMNTRGRIEASKKGTVPQFKWGDAWKVSKLEMSKLRTSIWKIRRLVARLNGELRARRAESHPEMTRYFTSDMTAACDVAEWLTE